MIYKQELLLKNKSTLKLSLSTFKHGINTETDENCLPYKYAKVTYNFDFKRGALQTGKGFKALTLPSVVGATTERTLSILGDYVELKKLWLFPYYDNETTTRDHMLLLSFDGYVKYVKIIGVNPVFANIDLAEELTFTSTPSAVYYNIDGTDVMLVSSPTDGMFTFKPSYTSELVADAPKIISICRHYERVFAIEEGKRNKLVFSANLDPTNWDISADDAGYIEIIDERGCLQKVVSFNDYVYIFKEYGISRLSAYGDQSEFSLSSMFVTSGKIYGNSVCPCGDRIMFLARDGIYSFNGYNATKLSLNIESMFEDNNDNCCSAYHNGKYYLGCKLKYDDDNVVGCESYEGGYVNNTLLELDLKTGEINLTRGVDLRDMCSIEYETVNKLAVIFNNEHKKVLGEMDNSGKIFDQPLTKVWTSPYTNLGYPDKIKKIKKFTLVSKQDCSVTVKTNEQSKTFEIKGSNKTSVVYPNIKGEMFQFTIQTTGDLACISCPEITIDVSK